MGLDQHVGNGDLVGQVGTLIPEARILVGADIVPGPAVEGAGPHPGDIVRRNVVAQQVAFVDGAPDVPGLRMNGQADTVADAGGVDLLVVAQGIERQHVGAVGLLVPGRAQGVRRGPDPRVGRRLLRHLFGDV